MQSPLQSTRPVQIPSFPTFPGDFPTSLQKLATDARKTPVHRLPFDFKLSTVNLPSSDAATWPLRCSLIAVLVSFKRQRSAFLIAKRPSALPASASARIAQLFGDVAVRKFANTRKGNRQAGYGLVFAAFGLIVLLGAAGLSVDIGYLRYQRRLLQSAADSAALAGAAVLGAGGGAGQANLAATNDSKINGFPDGGTVSVTPTPTTINGNPNTMQVTVQNVYQTFFMRIFGAAGRSVTVSTTATAQYIGSRGCIYALSGGGGINVAGSINTPNCNVLSNQNITGGGSIRAASIGAHGRSIATTPPAITGTLQATDPLSYLPGQGTGGGCNNTGNLTSAQNGLGPRTFSPGKYCGFSFAAKTKFNPGYTQNVHFNPGTYVITTGGLSFQGSGTVTGTGVTFYVAAGSVAFSNSQTIQLKASTNAPYAGVLIFQPNGNNNAATITGKGGSSLQGALYFPNATLTMSGAGTGAQYMLLVAKTLNINTAINFTSNYGTLPNGSPIRTSTLIQ